MTLIKPLCTQIQTKLQQKTGNWKSQKTKQQPFKKFVLKAGRKILNFCTALGTIFDEKYYSLTKNVSCSEKRISCS